MRVDSRSGSAPGSARMGGAVGNAARAATENVVLAAVRRQMEALEEKLTAQINRVQQQNDRFRDVAMSRVDSKMSTMEAAQPKIDRRLAELGGNYKGLSDEMQQQIRRVDQMDTRLSEWRRQLEEEIRGKLSDHDSNHQQLSSHVRVTSSANEDLMKRLQKRLSRLEGMVEERLGGMDDAHQHLSNFHDRLSDMESCRHVDNIAGQKMVSGEPQKHPEHESAILTLESALVNADQKLDEMQREMHKDHTRVEAQEERLKSLRTQLEAKQEQLRVLTDRVERVDWDGRFKELSEQMHQMSRSKLHHDEKVELLERKLENLERVENLVDQISHGGRHDHALSDAHAHDAMVPAMGDEPLAMMTNSDLSMEVKECTERLADLDVRVVSMQADLHNAHSEQQLAPRVGVLIEQLKDLAPKVIEQENSIRELHEKMGRKDVTSKMTVEKPPLEAVEARVHNLEQDVNQIKRALDGN